LSYPNIDEAVKEISKRHGVPEEKVWEKIEDKIEPEAEDESGRAKLGKILKMGGALGLAAALGFSVNEMASASPDSDREVITGRGMGTANNPFPQSHFESISTEQVSTTDQIKIGITSDVHWNDEGGRTLIEDLADIKDNLDIFIDDMNNSFEADVVIYLGDLVDQNLATDATDYGNLLGDATDYLENSGGPSGNGLNAPIHYVAGNHEAEYSDYGIWSELGFSSYSDTYYSFTVGDYEIIVLNTAGTDSRGTAPSAHIFRSEEIDWLENKLSENDKPKLVFMHIPPFEPIKSKDYDTVENERKVMDLLMGEPSVIVSFFWTHAPRSRI